MAETPVTEVAAAAQNEAEKAEPAAGGDGVEATAGADAGAGEAPAGPPWRIRRVAIFLGYRGEKYQGMQRNEGATTIEGVLMDAVVKSGIVPAGKEYNFFKLKWSRSARTDKGVSAAGQVVSSDLKCEQEGVFQKEFFGAINKHLPDDITIFGWMRTTGSFQAKADCLRRRYEYVMPEAALIVPGDGASTSEHAPSAPAAASVEGLPTPDRLTDSKGGPKPQTSDGGGKSDPRVAKFNALLQRYVGSHAFHNFTEGIDGSDATAQRYILECTCSEPFLLGDVRFVKVSLLGQSFVLHQIRKMIGLAVQAIDFFMLPNKKMHTPTAPALGLLLVECFFDSYNKRYKNDLRQPVTLDPFRDNAESFKREVLYTNIADLEKRTRSMERWLCGLPSKLDIDADALKREFENAASLKRAADERRQERERELYPVFTDVEQMFAGADDGTVGEKKQMVSVMKDSFCGSFATSPLSFARVPGSVCVVGDWQEINELPSLAFCLQEEVMGAVVRANNSETVRVEHMDPELANAELRPSGSKLAAAGDESRAQWSRPFSWGWQGGVSRQGVRPNRLPGAKVLVGGPLAPTESRLGADCAMVLLALMTFTDLNSWRMPRMEMGQLGFGWERQGRGSTMGLWRSICSMQGAARSLVYLQYVPKLQAAVVKVPDSLEFVVVLPAGHAATDPDQVSRRQLALRAELQLCARLLAKRASIENPRRIKSLGRLLEATKCALEDAEGLLEKLGVQPDAEVTVAALAEELGLELGVLQKQEPGSEALDVCRLGLLAHFAFREALAAEKVRRAFEAVADLDVDAIARDLRELQLHKDRLEPEEPEVLAIRDLCMRSGALSTTSSSHVLGGKYVLCTATGTGADALVAKLGEVGPTDGAPAFSVVKAAPSTGASILACAKKPQPKTKKRKLG